MARRRDRAKGRAEHGEKFARIPDWLLREPAVATCNHAAFRVLVISAAQCWIGRDGKTGRNGTAALTEAFARPYGLKGKDTLYRSLCDLSRSWLEAEPVRE